jgi:NAD+ kinase
MAAFKEVGIIGRLESDHVIDTVRELIELLQSRQLTVVLEDDIARLIPDQLVRVAARKTIGELCDLAIVVGGDGSLLGAGRALAAHDCAVLGINRGRLGFLTDIRPEQVKHKVGEVLDGKFRQEERFLLDVGVKRDGEVIARAEALNDVVINSGRSARMIDFDLYMDGKYVYSQDSDGLIVSTPTGSTAYALSGGGPIMHPDLDAIVLVPMFPHTLSARPIVVAGDTEIKVVIGKCDPYISCDGQVHLTTAPGDVVCIVKKPHKLKLIHVLNHDFYAACRDKLGWGNRLAK